MIQVFSSYIKSIAVFIVFISLIDLVIPEGKYKNYIHLVLGFILIFIMIEPVRSIFGNAEQYISLTFQTDREIMMKEQHFYEERQREVILSTYIDQLETQLERLVSNYDGYKFESGTVVVTESAENFGNIEKIYITVVEEEADTPFIRIEKVDIQRQSEEYKESEILKNLKKVISDFYNLSEENIYITVQRKAR